MKKMADEIILNKIMDEYEKLRQNAADKRRVRIEEINKNFPRISEIDKEISRRGLDNMNNILKNPEKKDEYNRDFKENLERLNAEKKKILIKNNIPLDYDKYEYQCKICNDTGYDENGRKCKCFMQKLINEAYSMSNMAEIIKTQNFDTFSFDYYSKEKDDNLISPYDNMVKIYNNAKRFCENFDNETKGIVFYGPTGLGKTFLSGAIAKAVMDSGKTVIYLRATKLFSIYEDYKFGRNKDSSVIDNIYNADLLIIDDLGTEPKNNVSFLFDFVNERIAANKKIIINTNLQISEITKMYSMRFTSRLYENFMMYKFFGEDIRILKFKKND
ncbi:MAG: ATP-binding protein [Oscillospiraceae bacterium]|nr:ATP-binding protein [Oscillospiraceae bacterium]